MIKLRRRRNDMRLFELVFEIFSLPFVGKGRIGRYERIGLAFVIPFVVLAIGIVALIAVVGN